MKDKRYLGFEQFLKVTQKEPNEEELKNMEKVLCKSTILKNYKNPINNLNYKPFLEGL